MNVASVICCRMSSERLPGKTLISYHPEDKPNLQCLIERILTSRHNQNIIIATSTDKSDDAIADFIHNYTPPNYHTTLDNKISLYRGDLDNVTKRLNDALQTFAPTADYVWRVMADCPLVDVPLVDLRIDILHRNKIDVLTYVGDEPTYAAQASIWSREAWEHCARMSSGSQLQHPGEYIYNNLSQFHHLREIGPRDVYFLPVRTELDTPQDLEFFRAVWGQWYSTLPEEMYGGSATPNTEKVLEWLWSASEIWGINSDVKMKSKSYHNHGDPRARRFVCHECETVLAYKKNDALEISCPKCGERRKFYP